MRGSRAPAAFLLVLLGLLGLLGLLVGAVAEARPAVDVNDRAYVARELVGPNPLPATNGLALDGHGHLYVAQALFDRVTRLDLAHRTARRVADDTDPVPQALQTPDDLTFGPDGRLYVTNVFKKSVVRMTPDGAERTTVAGNVTDGVTGPNGIAFRPDGRLFASDLAFDPSQPGGIFQVDPEGRLPALPITRDLRVPEGFAFASDGLAYVPEFYDGRIAVVDVGPPATVRRLSTRFAGLLISLKVVPRAVDPAEPLVVLETRVTGTRVWRVDRTSGKRTLLASSRDAVDNLAIDPRRGTIFVSNFIRGGISRVDPRRKTLRSVFSAGPLVAPVSLNPGPKGSLLVGDTTSFSEVSGRGRVTPLSRFIVNDNQGVTPSAVRVGDSVYYSDFLDSSRPGRLMRLDLRTRRRAVVASGFVLPWHVRRGPAGTLLLTDQGQGAVFRVNPADGSVVPIATGLSSPAGLAYDPAARRVYVSESGAGRVLAFPIDGGIPTVVAAGLHVPEGVALDGRRRLLVVEAEAERDRLPARPGRLLRIDLPSGRRTTVASRLPTRLTGITLVPGFNYSSDVLVRSNGTIAVTGDGNGSLIELVPRRRAGPRFTG